MDWTLMMTSSFAGLAATMVALALTATQGMRYLRWLPKRDVAESLDALKLQLDQNRNEWDRLNAEAAIARTDIDLAQQKRAWMDEAHEEVAHLESEMRELEKTRELRTQEAQELEAVRAQASDLAQQTQRLHQELSSQQAQVLSPDELEARQEEKRTLQLELEQGHLAVSKLNGEQEELAGQVGRLRTDVDELQVEAQRLRVEATEAETRRNELRKQIEDLREMKVAIGGPGAEQDSELSTQLLWEPAVRSGDFEGLADEGLQEDAALQLVETRIREQRFLYHPRVIRAFHTSLKCADDAPLTVLAGISGTGKSALPTRYAEAIGMHLETVPVQPGWDSPADLLGFYNHLEGRYRPTELMRALIQMDYVHGAAGEDAWPETCRNRIDLHDRMLLVLLDEMNLARVEYYFSEFLSRLELRRGVRVGDTASRRRSELIVDLGSTGSDDDREMRVFVGQNVLFVGTMNEDESTQTLSDKVIDRSNVMRFGRPNNLMLQENELEAVSTAPAPALPRQTWARWLKEKNPLAGTNDGNRVDTWVKDLNDILARVGKPFAYRVSKAIRSYVSHYPSTDARWVENAVADQVELRILPRLRGLDLHDQMTAKSIDDLRRLVAEELADEALAGALDAARGRSSDQLFQWSGLDRRTDT